MEGGSQACLVKANDGRHYVVKFRNNPQGTNVLFNDFMGTELLRRCGLLVPPHNIMWISDSFIQENSNCWFGAFAEAVRPESGWCFASMFQGTVTGRSSPMVLPAISYSRVHNRASFGLMWLLDIVSEQVDRRQVIFVEGMPGNFAAMFLDNGHGFGGPREKAGLPFKANLYFDYRVYPDLQEKEFAKHRAAIHELNSQIVWEIAQKLPDDWKSTSSLIRLARCLHNLGRANLIASIQHELVSTLDRRRTGQHASESPIETRLRSDLYGGLPCELGAGASFLIVGRDFGNPRNHGESVAGLRGDELA